MLLFPVNWIRVGIFVVLFFILENFTEDAVYFLAYYITRLIVPFLEM